MKKIAGLAAAGLLAIGSAKAGTLTVANSDLEMSGGITAGYFYTTNIRNSATASDTNNDYFTVSTFAIDLTSKINSMIGFTAGFGSTVQSDLLEVHKSAEGFELEYGWVSIRPVEGLTIDAGILLTNIGYELYHTYDNKNYTFGMVWWGQPVNYAGARATYTVAEGIDVYAEYGQNVLNTSDAFAVGSLGSVQNISYAISYFDESSGVNMVDVVLSTDVEGIELGINADYQWLDDSAPGNDDTAYGIALYASAKMDVFEIPVRIEYVNDGTSGIYGIAGDDAWSFTITPTYKPSENTFVRAEFAYVNTDDKGFYDDDGNAKDSRTFIGVEAGFMF
ncbi:Putative beta-barrel porin-2, OmpL-like. bbp2 [Persephonella hydrogeniphila]|uniref:Putative beta-barrel porin-2, OmpL-like. bbp2 n=1 Tax=Persephonella hydrogeniphila TaxID=198703 RepID=A0A285NCT0_9AQUI|nr:outer membrane beta-barrel protein [Persephonella hydrogeniphila]SNZ07098.1 Putative beta-barrel porin-2, OmpL-like. bbp2 [Persephonella hydrogeniphila]